MTNFLINRKDVCGQFCEYNEAKYAKFIPVYKKKKGYKLPQSKIDKEASKCWFDIQKWYIDYVDEKLFRKRTLKISHSDTCVHGERDKCQHNCKIKEMYFDQTCRKNLVTHKRFGTNNIKFLTYGSLNETSESRTSVEFYVKIVKEQQSMLRLCHLKTEMIVSCLKIYFKPYDDTTVLWVEDLNAHLEKATKRHKKDIFNETVIEKKAYVKAILFLDKNASKLIRHKDLAFLETLATIVEIKKEELVIFPSSVVN